MMSFYGFIFGEFILHEPILKYIHSKIDPLGNPRSDELHPPEKGTIYHVHSTTIYKRNIDCFFFKPHSLDLRAI